MAVIPAMANTVTLSRAIPNTSGTTPQYVANTNPSDTPSATGTITVAQSPKGVITTNTNRSISSTATYMAAKLNVLNIPH